MGKLNPRVKARIRRRKRIRKRLAGTPERPRLSVFRSNKHIYAQIIDDDRGVTLAAASSLSPEVRQKIADLKGKITVAQEVGRLVAVRAKNKGVTKVAFDRGGYKYHGRVKALAEGAREGGLDF